MAEPVNLNRVRKQKARADDKARAGQNAVRFGRTGAEKDREQARGAKEKRDLDGHRSE